MSLNQETFTNLYDAHRDRLLNAMTAVVKNREAAEDITSRAFAAAFERLATFRGESSFYSWLFAIAMNQARADLRRGRGRAMKPLDAYQADAFSEPAAFEAGIERSECCLRLRRALRQVPALYRYTLTRHFLHGHSVRLIARQDRVPVGTILSRLFTGKQHLRQAWKAVTSE